MRGPLRWECRASGDLEQSPGPLWAPHTSRCPPSSAIQGRVVPSTHGPGSGQGSRPAKAHSHGPRQQALRPAGGHHRMAEVPRGPPPGSRQCPTCVGMCMHKVYFYFNVPAKGPRKVFMKDRTRQWAGERIRSHFMALYFMVYWLHLARARASTRLDRLFLNVQGELHWIRSEATCTRRGCGGWGGRDIPGPRQGGKRHLIL